MVRLLALAATFALALPSGSGELPAPLPPPVQADDALELLWSHRLQFDAAGEPLVAIRVAEGRPELAFRAPGAARLVPRGGPEVKLPPGAALRARVIAARPAALAHAVLLEEHAPADAGTIAEARRRWEERGVAAEARVVGAAAGIGGKVVDSRRVLLVAPARSEPEARALAARLRDAHGIPPEIVPSLRAPPSGTVEVRDGAGRVLARGDRLVSLASDAGFEILGGAHATAHRGQLHLTVAADGGIVAVEAIGLEALLRGLVPSELPASSPREALRAQAVTARSNVLAQLGTRHLTDPFSLCDEVHCQAYRGSAAETPATDEAVRATAGETLLDRAGALVDGVYSAVCGGHGEDADAVWPRLESGSLRGAPDVPGGPVPWARELGDERRLRAFLASPPRAWCAGAPAGRFRWERSVGWAELTRLAAPLGLGEIRALRVLRRGVSGRALAIELAGPRGRAELEGELRIRRLLGGLHSAMFVVDAAPGGVVLRGGGWGHGAGMCQWGAVGRARAGQGYREILGAYFAGAEVAPLY